MMAALSHGSFLPDARTRFVTFFMVVACSFISISSSTYFWGDDQFTTFCSLVFVSMEPQPYVVVVADIFFQLAAG
jgi:hypothetical protein